MIKDIFYGRMVRLVSAGKKEWTGKVEIITNALDSDSGEAEIAIEHYGGLVNFQESEIESIEIIPETASDL